MKGNEQVVSVLNQVLRKELTGINQYFIHAKMCENWGYRKLKKGLMGRVDRGNEARGSNYRTTFCSLRECRICHCL